jgi:ribosomal protein S18 acetylase RimI-like enzyme
VRRPDLQLTAELASRRWQAIDPLLPAGPGWAPGCGVGLAVDEPGGGLVAAGSCGHLVAEPGSIDFLEGAALRFRLTPHLTGSDVLPSLDTLLSRWRDHLATVPEAAGEDTAALICWPSRDVAGVRALVAHGLTPLAVTAARSASLRPAVAADCPPGVRIRRATHADLDVVVRMTLEVLRFDAHFGGVIERPGTTDVLRAEIAGPLGEPDPWIWLAERGGDPVGALVAERPEDSGWIAPQTRLSPVAYLLALFVAPAERGSGVGAALAGQLHRAVAAAAVPVVLLQYEQVNPLAVPFWGRQGYRPLWTTWETRPARMLR